MRRTVLQLVVLAACFASVASGFDIGHHFDVTYMALADEGFSDNATRAAMFYNWAVDYNSNDIFGSEQDHMLRMHFDNELNRSMLLNDFDRYATNVRAAVENATGDGDVLGLVAVIGFSLHSIQDFYAHSSWVEAFSEPGNDSTCYMTRANAGTINLAEVALRSGFTDTVDTALLNQNGGNDPSHGHGDYTCGMNKDSYVRDRWIMTQRFAYFASRELIRQVRVWAGNASMDAAAAWEPATATESDLLDFGLNNAYKIAMFSTTDLKGGDQGHWKGSGSGLSSAFLAAYAELKANAGFMSSDIVKEVTVKQRHRIVSQGLMQAQAAPLTPDTVAPLAASAAEVEIRILAAEYTGTTLLQGDIDMYTRVTIAGHEFRDAIQRESASVMPRWTTVRLFSTAPTVVAVTMELWDYDTLSSDDQLDINPSGATKTLTFSYNLTSGTLSGDVTGTHHNTATAISIAGDDAKISFYVTHRTVHACPREAADKAFDNWVACSSGSATWPYIVGGVVIGALLVAGCAGVWYRHKKNVEAAKTANVNAASAAEMGTTAQGGAVSSEAATRLV